MRKLRGRLRILFTGLGLLMQVALAASPSAEAWAGETAAADELYRLSAEDFFDLESVRQPIDPKKVEPDLLSAAVFHETNLRRKAHQKDPLAHDALLDKAAGLQARSMARHDFVGHVNPYASDLRTPLDRARQAGFEPLYLAENVATHFGIQYTPGEPAYLREKNGKRIFSDQPGGPPIPAHTYRSFARSLLDQWMNSPEHRHNILSPKPALLGTACAAVIMETGMPKFYCAQVFGESRP